MTPKEEMQVQASAVTSWDVGPFESITYHDPQNQIFQQEEKSVDSSEG